MTVLADIWVALKGCVRLYTRRVGSRETLYGKTASILKDRDQILAEDKRTNETGEPFQVEYRIKRKDGCYIWVREDLYLIRDQEGNPSYWHGIMFDITAQKEAQEAAAVNEGSYRGWFNTVAQAIYIQDKDGRFLDVNDGAVKMYGFPRQ